MHRAAPFAHPTIRSPTISPQLHDDQSTNNSTSTTRLTMPSPTTAKQTNSLPILKIDKNTASPRKINLEQDRITKCKGSHEKQLLGMHATEACSNHNSREARTRRLVSGSASHWLKILSTKLGLDLRATGESSPSCSRSASRDATSPPPPPPPTTTATAMSMFIGPGNTKLSSTTARGAKRRTERSPQTLGSESRRRLRGSLPLRLEPAPGTAVSTYAHEAISSVANAGCRRRKTWLGIDGILSLSEERNGEGRRGRKLGEKERESEGKRGKIPASGSMQLGRKILDFPEKIYSRTKSFAERERSGGLSKHLMTAGGGRRRWLRLLHVTRHVPRPVRWR